MSMGILVLAFVVHVRPLLLTKGSVRWMILITRRERLRFRGTACNIVVVTTWPMKKERKRNITEDRPATFLDLEKETKQRNEQKVKMAAPADPRCVTRSMISTINVKSKNPASAGRRGYKHRNPWPKRVAMWPLTPVSSRLLVRVSEGEAPWGRQARPECT
jgi:hypothetical protein